jgi:hypothetical protein
MKTYAIIAAVALLAGTASPSVAFDRTIGRGVDSHVTRVSCDTHQEDEQAVCASKCEDAYLKQTMSFSANLDKVKASKKACDEKCGCPQNTKF